MVQVQLVIFKSPEEYLRIAKSHASHTCRVGGFVTFSMVHNHCDIGVVVNVGYQIANAHIFTHIALTTAAWEKS